MLVITRKLKESLLIGKDLSITILNIRSEQVKVGVEAPLDVRVVRGELLGEICQRNRSAARILPSHLQGLRLDLNSGGILSFEIPDVYVELETDNLDSTCCAYCDLGFALRKRTVDCAWLERSGLWLRCGLNSQPHRELRLGFSNQSAL